VVALGCTLNVLVPSATGQQIGQQFGSGKESPAKVKLVEGYKSIRNGMTIDQVQTIMGKGKQCDGHRTVFMKWAYLRTVVSVTFIDGKVVHKDMQDDKGRR
jgi:hypothetical protein